MACSVAWLVGPNPADYGPLNAEVRTLIFKIPDEHGETCLFPVPLVGKGCLVRCHPLLEGVARQANVEFRLLCRRCYSDIRSVYYVGGEALIAERTVILDPAITGRGKWTEI